MKWLRVHHDLENEPKIRLVAVESGQIEAVVLAVWVRMMICASKSANRGTLEDWDDRLVGVTLGLKGAIVAEIRQAMQGVFLDGDRLTGWEKRQRDGSDDAAERKRRSRARKAEKDAPKPDDGGHGPNGADPDGHATVTGPSRDKSGHGHVTSETCHVTPSRATQTLDSEEDSVASATAPPEGGASPPPSLTAELYGSCLRWLMRQSGRSEKSLRAVLGQWRKSYGDGAVLEAIAVAQRESAVSPVGFIEKVLQARSRDHGTANGSKHDRLIHGLAGAFSDLLDPGPEASGGDRRPASRGYH